MPALHVNPTRSCPAVGPTNARIIIVGEAPSKHEMQRLQPFVGPAGSVLNECLHAAGIARSDCYITNLVKYEVQDIRTIYDDRKKRLTAEGQRCQAALLAELEDVQANVIVTLGTPATFAVTGKAGIMKWRGSILPALNTGRKVIPTLHPAITLYGTKKVKQSIEGKSGTSPYIYRYFITQDLQRVQKEMAFPEIRYPKRRLYLTPTVQEVLVTLQQMRKQRKLLACDIEVFQHQIACIALCNDPNFAISIPFDKTYKEEDEAEIWYHLALLLEDPNVPKLFQNGAFDMWFLALRLGILTRGHLDDTMLAHHVIYPDFPKGLDFLTSCYTNEPYYKDEGKVHKLRTISDPIAFRRYNAKDVCCTLESWLAFSHEIDEQGYRWTYDMHMRMTYPALFMMLRGIKVDREGLSTMRATLSKKLAETEAELNRVVGKPLNYNSQKECIQYFYTDLKIPPYTKAVHTLQGVVSRPTVDDTALTRLARGTASRPPLQAAKLIQECRGLNKQISTYVGMSFDEDGRFRSQVNLRGTTTGRLSTGKTVFGTGMNMQNLTPLFKKFLVADEGFLLEVDKRHAEWVASAYIFGDERMIQVVEAQKDPHTATASMMLGIPEDIIKEEDKVIGHITDPVEIEELRSQHPEWKDALAQARFLPRNMSLRQCGKKSNHGLNYDEGANMFSLVNLIPENQARLMVELYHQAYPGIRQGHERIRQELRVNRVLENPWGRRRRFLDRWGESLFKEAYAFLPSSTVVDLIDLSMCYIYEADDPLLRRVELRAQVHDSLLYQVPCDGSPESIQDAAKTILAIVDILNTPIEYRGRTFSIGSEAKVGLRWGALQEIDLNPTNIVESLKSALEKTVWLDSSVIG